MSHLNKFQVGCDPEFFVLEGAQLVNLKGKIPHEGEVGYDHSGDVAELRPEPAFLTRTLVRRMGRLIWANAAAIKLHQYKWRGGAKFKNRVIGGHIHFGIPASKASEVVAALDTLTKKLEEWDILPAKESEQRRKTPAQDAGVGFYGKFGDTRPSGKDKHLEYRTMSSWLFSPRATFLCLTLGKLAVLDPEGFREELERITTPRGLEKLLLNVREDADARRLGERTLRLNLVADPEVDIKTAWRQYERLNKEMSK